MKTSGAIAPSSVLTEFSSSERGNPRHSSVSAHHAQLRRVLLSLERGIEFRDRSDLSPYVHWKGNGTEPIHRWYKYREAYSPSLIDKLDLGARILDPFCGCGSIMIGGATRGRTTLGVDLNPLATFSGRVKLSPLDQKQLAVVTRFLERLPFHARKGRQWPLSELSISDKVFEPEILKVLMSLRGGIQDASSGDLAVEQFLLLGWLSVLETVGSYFKEGNGIKYRNVKRAVGKYAAREDGEWQLVRFGSDQKAFVIDALTSKLSAMLSDVKYWKTGAWQKQKIIDGNALDLEQICGRRQFDSIVFSPPYANRFDYFESCKVELWFGNFVQSYEDMGKLRKNSLRSHLGADLKRSSSVNDALEELISLMDQSASSWRMGVPNLLRGYFDDMDNVIRACRKLSPNGQCYIVIGNSAFAGTVIPTDVLIARLAKQAGYKSVSIAQTRHLTVAPQQRSKLQGFESFMRESIVVLG